MKKEQFDMLVKLVRKEADSIKSYASPSEIFRLNFTLLDAGHAERCVYGQMTGDCYSYRATDLIQNCAEKVYLCGLGGLDEDNLLNGSPKDIQLQTIKERRFTYHSPIELFIYLMERNNSGFANKMLLDYIQGKRKTFKPVLDIELI